MIPDSLLTGYSRFRGDRFKTEEARYRELAVSGFLGLEPVTPEPAISCKERIRNHLVEIMY